jgi:hypothetical protein
MLHIYIIHPLLLYLSSPFITCFKSGSVSCPETTDKLLAYSFRDSLCCYILYCIAHYLFQKKHLLHPKQGN